MLPEAVLILGGGGGRRLDRDAGGGGAVDAPSDSSRTRAGTRGALAGGFRSGVGGTALASEDEVMLLGRGGGVRPSVDGPDLDGVTRGGNRGAAFVAEGESLRLGIEGDGREGMVGGLAVRVG